ncbi:MAG: HNH endonuclease signature motif containing protein [Ilumatobacteraceae bacterium]
MPTSIRSSPPPPPIRWSGPVVVVRPHGARRSTRDSSSERFFTGDARQAAKLLVRRCTHPGCTVCPEHADVDHCDEWYRDDGSTDQWNANVECPTHNRYKSRARWRVRRDESGRRVHQRPDGTFVLPVGARQPDLSTDDLDRAIRVRLAGLRSVA